MTGVQTCALPIYTNKNSPKQCDKCRQICKVKESRLHIIDMNVDDDVGLVLNPCPCQHTNKNSPKQCDKCRQISKVRESRLHIIDMNVDDDVVLVLDPCLCQYNARKTRMRDHNPNQILISTIPKGGEPIPERLPTEKFNLQELSFSVYAVAYLHLPGEDVGPEVVGHLILRLYVADQVYVYDGALDHGCLHLVNDENKFPVEFVDKDGHLNKAQIVWYRRD